MFVVNEDLSIYVTRGDTVFFRVTATENGTAHRFRLGDVVRMKVVEKKNYENVVLQKDFPITADTEAVDIILTEDDTKIGGVISKPVDYWYEIELNPFDNPQTIVGYDDDGAKIFKLFPEGRDLTTETKEEDLPVVDKELDLTSERPVQNQAISRAIISIGEDAKEAVKTSTTFEGTLKNLDTRVSNIVGQYNDTSNNSELIDIRTSRGGKVYVCAGDYVRAIEGEHDQLEHNFLEFAHQDGVIPLTYRVIRAIRDKDFLYNLWYFDDFTEVISEINAGHIYERETPYGFGTIDQFALGIVYVNKEGIPEVVLKENITIDTLTTISKDMVLNLNGKCITLGAGVRLDVGAGANVTFDGRIEGSKISKDLESSTTKDSLVYNYGNLKVLGGNYYIRIDTPAYPVYGIVTNTGAVTTIEGSKIEVYQLTTRESSNKSYTGIYTNGNCTINNCYIHTNVKSDLSNGAVANNGTMTIAESKVFADGTSGGIGTGSGTAIGITNSKGNLTLQECDVYGTHSGIQCTSTTRIKGGVYRGVGHGGLYNGNAKDIVYVENATLSAAKYEGANKTDFTYYIDEAGALRNQYNISGLYIGGANGIITYLDGCKIISGTDNAIAIRSTDGECNNSLYMSNCTVSGDKKTIRIDSDTHKVYIGWGNNVTAEDAERPECVSITTDIYIEGE